MATTEGSASGGRSDPAAVSTGDDRIVLWPSRSLPAKGRVAVVAAVTVAVMLPLCQVCLSTVAGKSALAMVALPCLTAPAALALAFWCNTRAARIQEKISIAPERLVFARSGPAARARTETFNPYWVRVEVRSDGRIPHRILLAEGSRRIAVGDFLSADERLELARELRERLGAARVRLPSAAALAADDRRSADFG